MRITLVVLALLSGIAGAATIYAHVDSARPSTLVRVDSELVMCFYVKGQAGLACFPKDVD